MSALPEFNRFTFVKATCPICSGEDSTPRHRITKFDQGVLTFVTCDECGTVYQNPRPDQDSLHGFYATENFFNAGKPGSTFVGYLDYDAEEQTRQKNAAERLREIESLFPQGQKLRILKIACGYGTLVKLALDAGHHAVGIDFSDVMAKGARERYGINLIRADFMDHDFGDECFDVIILYGAINNLLDPVGAGRRIFKLLVPGGYYLTNFVEPDSIIERIQGGGFWLYRPPIIGLWTSEAFIATHRRIGMGPVMVLMDVQWASLTKLVGYLQARPLVWFISKIGLGGAFLKLPTPGYAKVILRRPTKE